MRASHHSFLTLCWDLSRRQFLWNSNSGRNLLEVMLLPLLRRLQRASYAALPLKVSAIAHEQLFLTIRICPTLGLRQICSCS